MKRSDFLSCLIQTAYLPKELPPIITSRHFSKFCLDEFVFLEGQLGSLLKLSTKYDTFTAPRSETGRRNLALVHPLGQLPISLLITKHRSTIRKMLVNDGASFYESNENIKKRLAFSGLNFESWRAATKDLYSLFPIVLKADISRFFYTIYTHSIPWAVLGKDKAKQWHFNNPTNLKKHWSSDFDRALQVCQSRETFGIPVGPDTSRIIAEILMCGMYSTTKLGEILGGGKSIRLVDDILIGFNDEEAAYAALTKLRSIFWTYNLQLNEAKTGVFRTKTLHDPKWKIDFESLVISESDEKQQRKQIYLVLDMALHFCTETKSSTPANWASARISQIKNNDYNFDVILEVLFRLARDFPKSISHVCSFFINNQALCLKNNRSKLIELNLKNLLKLHIRYGHDFEIAWCLLASSVMKITWQKDELMSLDILPHSVVLAILGLMNEKHLLKFSFNSWAWKKKLKETGALGEYWLPYYEAVRRGWTKDKKMVAAIKSQPVFAKMLAAKITFLEDAVMTAGKIDLKKRVFGSKIGKNGSPIKYVGMDWTFTFPAEDYS